MHLSWNEIRARAARFASEWKDAHYERGESQTFYNEFFEVFGVPRRRVATFEEPVKRLGNRRGFIDLFWKGVLLVEQKSEGGDLVRAKKQAFDYFPDLKDFELPRYVLVSDFQNFELYDLDDETGKPVEFKLAQLPSHVQHFSFILGVQKRQFRDQDPVNIEASELMGKLHDKLKDTGYVGHDLERFLVRVLFCLFADSTGIFEPPGIFGDYIRDRTREDGSDLGGLLSQLFQVLNTPDERRHGNLDEDLARFPYVNGDLFEERLPIPSFDSPMRAALLEVCDFSWERISPAIFGSLFQSVMDKEHRRAQGAHYTTERNIMKVIQPLFLDGLHAEFEQLKKRRDTGRTAAIKKFHEKLGTLKFFDPACGCGNFLIIAYRELRLLEIEILKVLRTDGQLELDVSRLSKIDVDQFFGIELSEFPARIAEVAMWMMDHIMNNRLSLEFGDSYIRIPLKKSPHIKPVDALETDWESVLPAADCSYIYGNPPFVGAKYQSTMQREQVRRIARLGGSGGTLDYVSAWFIKAGEYIQKHEVKVGFVATNSVTQGEQVAQLWPVLFDRYGLEIAFAHRTFAWGSDARGKAHVHVVIIGLTPRDHEPPVKRLFSYPDIKLDPVESNHGSLAAYLFDASRLSDRHLVVSETSQPINGAPKMIIGSKPIDGGYLIFDEQAKLEFLKTEPAASKFVHPFIGASEYLYGQERWILAVQKATPGELRGMPAVGERLKLVKRYRKGEIPPKRSSDNNAEVKPPGISARALAETPAEFHVTVIPDAPFLAVPEVTSETRDYVPIGWLEPPVIPSNKLRFILKADLWHFGVLTSAMHMAWLKDIGGRLESRFQYGIGIVYNTFPWPDVTETQRAKIKTLAQDVLKARAKFHGSSLADLYDSDLMKPELRRAHRALDLAVDKLYRAAPFSGDRERVEHLFTLYEKLVNPLMAGAQPKPPRRKKLKVAVR
jgi:hypothetical protein